QNGLSLRHGEKATPDFRRRRCGGRSVNPRPNDFLQIRPHCRKFGQGATLLEQVRGLYWPQKCGASGASIRSREVRAEALRFSLKCEQFCKARIIQETL